MAVADQHLIAHFIGTHLTTSLVMEQGFFAQVKSCICISLILYTNSDHESVNFCLGYQENYIQKYYFLYIKTHSSVVIFGHSSAWRCDIYSQLLPSGIFDDAHMSDLISWTFLTCRDFYDLSKWNSPFISRCNMSWWNMSLVSGPDWGERPLIPRRHRGILAPH